MGVPLALDLHVTVRRGEGLDHGKRNAHLVSASPAMLEALEFVNKYAAMKSEQGSPLPSQLTNVITRALSQAKGN